VSTASSCFPPESEQLDQELLATLSREPYGSVFDLAGCDAQPGPLVLDLVHGRNGKDAALQLIECRLLIGHRLSTKNPLLMSLECRTNTAAGGARPANG
jgi:hypothetical protein